jgi:hypothetical protein
MYSRRRLLLSRQPAQVGSLREVFTRKWSLDVLERSVVVTPVRMTSVPAVASVSTMTAMAAMTTMAAMTAMAMVVMIMMMVMAARARVRGRVIVVHAGQ